MTAERLIEILLSAPDSGALSEQVRQRLTCYLQCAIECNNSEHDSDLIITVKEHEELEMLMRVLTRKSK